jgi:hypothetical protein
LETAFCEASVALNLFLPEYLSRSNPISRDEAAETERRDAIWKRVEEAHPEPLSAERMLQVAYEKDAIFRFEEWENGTEPESFKQARLFMFAKAFLFAFDSFYKALNVLAKNSLASATIAALVARMDAEFPDVVGVRNSAHHPEDRIRRLKTGGKTIDVKTPKKLATVVNATGGTFFAVQFLNGTKYGNTMADGEYGEIDVSADSLEKLRQVFQETLDSFAWGGFMSVLPR